MRKWDCRSFEPRGIRGLIGGLGEEVARLAWRREMIARFGTRGAVVRALATAAAIGASGAASAQSKDVEPATLRANETFAASLPFYDTRDFEGATRGLIATIPDGLIAGNGPRPAFNLKPFDFEQAKEPPPTVNPSLWRQARLNAIHGLFKVVDRVYQVRGYDISNMTIIEGDTGLIVIDPLLSAETAKAAIELYYSNRQRKPVVAATEKVGVGMRAWLLR